MNHISLFSGIGGIDLAAEKAGFETIVQVENDDYATKVLEKHWPRVHRVRDIRDFPDQDYEAITLISGGFPCQPFSVAGKRRGKEDDRYFWPEMFKVIQEFKPTWVLGENVAGFVNMGLEDAISDLESTGYETQSFLIPACSVGAWHKRNRIFIVAHSNCSRIREQSKSDVGGGCETFAELYCKTMADSDGDKRYGRGSTLQMGRGKSKKEVENDGYPERTQWSVEPDVGRVAHGILCRVDRLRCLGNAVVPAQVYPILRGIADIEGAAGNA